MKCVHYTEVKGKEVEMQDVKDVTMRVAIGPKDGAPNFVMRVFTVKPGGHSPHHTHAFEHETFFHQGTGEVQIEDKTYPLRPGSVAFVPPNVLHQFRNTGDEDLVFICLVPKDLP